MNRYLNIHMKKYIFIFSVFYLLIINTFCFGQTPVNIISTISNYVVPGGTFSQVVTSHVNAYKGLLPSTNYTVNYNNNDNVKTLH
jgi:hypothetical protein